MARQEKALRQEKAQLKMRQRTLRRNQIIFVVLSGIIILSMVLSLMVKL